MKPTGLLTAVALLAVLGGLVYWSVKREGSDAKGTDSATKLLAIPEDQFQEIRIKKVTGEVIALSRETGKWRITEPKPLAADQDAVSSIVTALGALNADKPVEDKATDLQPYGLNQPTLDVQIKRKDGKTEGVLIGDDTPTGSGAYVKLPGDAKVSTIASMTKTSLDKRVDDLRDKRLLSFEQDKLTRVELQAKGQTIEFGKNSAGEWQIVKPRPLRADSSSVSTLVDKLRDAKMDLTATEDAAKGFAAAPRIALATITDSGGTQTLEIHRDKDKNVFAKGSAIEGFYKVAADIGEAVDKGLDDFRSKKLFDFGFSDPSKVDLKNASYTKSGDKWTAGGKTMDNASVQTLIDKLRDLSASKFAESGGGDVVFEATVASNSGKRTEKVLIRKQGARYFAQRDGEPSIYELDAAPVDDLIKAAGDVKEAAPAEPAKKVKPGQALLTDLYELTMAAGYFETGKIEEKATFELTFRRLPENRNYLLAAGLAEVVEYLLNLSFTGAEIDYLRGLVQFANVSPGFFEYLRAFRFTGDVFAMPEGTPVFPGEPVLTVRAPIIEAQIPETFASASIGFQTMIASKAARCVHAAGGRPVIEFGTRRAHSPDAGVLGARAAYIGGCARTSNTLAGFRFGIPVAGTSAHSWVMSFPCEIDAFRKLQRVFGAHAVHLLDTYDTARAAQRAAGLGRPLWGVRLDSGDFDVLSREVRGILDAAGLHDAKIMVSSDLDEQRIRDLVRAGAPIDAFGVGTQLATSADAPAMSAVYKLAETDIAGIKRFTAKYSQDKGSIPGSKQVFREESRDVIARSGECGKGEALLRPVILGGQLVEPLPTLEESRTRAATLIAKLPAPLRELEEAEPWPVILSRELRELTANTRLNLHV